MRVLGRRINAVGNAIRLLVAHYKRKVPPLRREEQQEEQKTYFLLNLGQNQKASVSALLLQLHDQWTQAVAHRPREPLNG